MLVLGTMLVLVLVLGMMLVLVPVLILMMVPERVLPNGRCGQEPQSPPRCRHPPSGTPDTAGGSPFVVIDAACPVALLRGSSSDAASAAPSGVPSRNRRPMPPLPTPLWRSSAPGPCYTAIHDCTSRGGQATCLDAGKSDQGDSYRRREWSCLCERCVNGSGQMPGVEGMTRWSWRSSELRGR